MSDWKLTGQGVIKWSVKTTYTKDGVTKGIIKYIIRYKQTSLQFVQFVEKEAEPMINGTTVNFDATFREKYYDDKSQGYEALINTLEFVSLEDKTVPDQALPFKEK